jgi:hypothetical protein
MMRAALHYLRFSIFLAIGLTSSLQATISLQKVSPQKGVEGDLLDEKREIDWVGTSSGSKPLGEERNSGDAPLSRMAPPELFEDRLQEIADQLNRRAHFKYLCVDGDALKQYPEWNCKESVDRALKLLDESREAFPILDGMTLPMRYANPITNTEEAVALRCPTAWVPGTPIIILVGDPSCYPPEAYLKSCWIINLPVSNSGATTLRDYHRIREDCLATLPQIKSGNAILIGAGEGASAALQMANRHPERFSAVAFSGAPSPAPLPHLDEKVIVHFCGEENYLDLMTGRSWIHHLHARGNLRAYELNGSVVDAIHFILDLDAQELLPSRGAE